MYYEVDIEKKFPAIYSEKVDSKIHVLNNSVSFSTGRAVQQLNRTEVCMENPMKARDRINNIFPLSVSISTTLT